MRSVIIALILLFCFPLLLSAGQMLVEDGKSDYSIVIADDAIEAERTAAQELSEHLFKISGAKLPIISAGKATNKKIIAVGFNEKTKSFAKKYPPKTFGAEEYIIAPEGEMLILAGSRPRGTLYAVYAFLDNLGVRWFTPKETFIPEKRDIAFPDTTIRRKPEIKLRSYLANNGADKKWTARNRLNEFHHWSNTGAKYGGTTRQGPDCHTFWRMIRRDELQKNPDWFAMVNGKRDLPAGTNHWGLCLTNKELRQRLILRTLQYAEKNPDVEYVWIAQNDGSPYCSCKKCKEFYKKHGGEPSSLIVLLANEMAEVLSKKLPGKKVKTLAYSWSQKPPKNIKVSDDVIISLCAPPSSSLTPLRRHDSGMGEILREWKKIANNLEIYLYPFPFELTMCYWFPIPNIYTAADDIKWAYENGVRYYYVYNTSVGRGKGCELIDLRSWLLPRVLLDPTADTQELIKEFCEKYYGPAAGTVLQAIRLTHDASVDEEGNPKSYGHGHVMIPDYLDRRMIRKVNRLIQKQLSRMPKSKYKKRLEYVWLPYLFTDFWFGFNGPGKFNEKSNTWSVELHEPELRNQYAKLIKRIMIQQGITAIKQLKQINPAKLAIDMMGIKFNAHLLRDKFARAVVVPKISGQVFEFYDNQNGFKPLAPCYGNRYWEYPLQGPWRDFVNRQPQRSYKLSKSTKNSVELASKRIGMEITRKVSLCKGVLHNTTAVKALFPTTVQLSTQPMFNLEDSAFGQYPDLYIEKINGNWEKINPGRSVTRPYLVGRIDLTGKTGRVILASQTRPQGVLVTVDPKQIERFVYEYNSHYTAKVLTFMPVTPIKQLKPSQIMSLDFSIEIINDVKSWLSKK